MITTNMDNDRAANHLRACASAADGFFSQVLSPGVGKLFSRLLTDNSQSSVNGDKKRLVLTHRM